jgi:hypothetical protein
VSRHEDEPQNIPIVPNEYPKNEKLISLFYPICLNFFSADEKTTFGDKLYLSRIQFLHFSMAWFDNPNFSATYLSTNDDQ